MKLSCCEEGAAPNRPLQDTSRTPSIRAAGLSGRGLGHRTATSSPCLGAQRRTGPRTAPVAPTHETARSIRGTLLSPPGLSMTKRYSLTVSLTAPRRSGRTRVEQFLLFTRSRVLRAQRRLIEYGVRVVSVRGTVGM